MRLIYADYKPQTNSINVTTFENYIFEAEHARNLLEIERDDLNKLSRITNLSNLLNPLFDCLKK